MNKVWRQCVVLSMLVACISGCGKGDAGGDELLTSRKTTTEAIVEGAKLGTRPYDTWLTYWDQEEGLAALEVEEKQVRSVSLFEVFFNSEGDLVTPENFGKMKIQTSQRYDGEIYVTVVNDILRGGGSILQKDTNLLEKLLGTVETRRKLITDLLGILSANQAFGLDLDFENIEKQGSPALQQHYLNFIGELYESLQAEGKKLRLFIEPGEDFGKFQQFADVEILIMCYNLHGPHGAAPGPKADRAFLQQLAKKAAFLPNKTFILADGGFAWDAQGQVTTLARDQLQALADHDHTKRDASGALKTIYTENGDDKEAWFADQKTLSQWVSWICELDQEARFGVWRLGS